MAALTNQARRCLCLLRRRRRRAETRPKAAMSSSPKVDSDFASEISLGTAAAPPAAGEQTGDLDLADRHALRRVAGLSTELTDVTEVEYRALRLERVVLVGVWTEGTLASAENSLLELSRLAETAGSVVLAGLVQRRGKPDPATYIGAGGAAGTSRPSPSPGTPTPGNRRC